MPLTRQFRSKIPMELQLQVWDVYVKSQPVVRHEFTTLKDMNEASLWYLASDERSHRYIDSIIKPEQSVDGLIYDKIHLPDVKVLRPPYTRGHLPELLVTHLPTEATRATIKVIFERDIFYFNCRRCFLMYKETPFGNGAVLNKWRALMSHPTSDLLQPHHDWIVNIQKLALLYPPPNDDFGVLTRMVDLKTVYIVIKEASIIETPAQRFVELEAFGQISRLPVDDEDGEKARENLMSLFAKHNMNVEVKLVVDSCSWSYT